LAIIEASDPIHVYFSISESDFLRFLELIRTQALPDPEKEPPVLYMGLASETGFPHKGVLDYRDPSVDPETGTILRRGRFDNPDGYLVPGLFARIRAPIGQPVPKLLIEERAISTDQRGDYVLVVDDSNTVEYRPVKLGLTQGGRRVVEEGLQADEWVVVNGLQRARPETIVDPERISPPESEPSPAKAAPDEPPSKVN
jgi:membrane fusion protein (multidrug efflux system)